MKPAIHAILLSVPFALVAGCKAECVGCQPTLDPGRPDPVAHRFEVELWELPVERAAELHRAPDPVSSSVALSIDEKGVRKPMRELAARDPAVRRVDRPAFEAPSGSRGVLPTRAGGAGERGWADGLRLELGAGPGADWVAHDLDFAVVWTSPQGERLAEVRGETPLPPDLDVLVWCVPSRTLADLSEPRTARAVLAIVRLVPRYE